MESSGGEVCVVGNKCGVAVVGWGYGGNSFKYIV